MKKTNYVWCSRREQNKALAVCPRCSLFPCEDLTEKHLVALRQICTLHQVVQKLHKTREAGMFFIETENGEIVQHDGDLASMPKKLAGSAVRAHEVSHCYQQKLVWVVECRQAPAKKGKPAGAALSVVVDQQGQARLAEFDPMTPAPDVARIYPVRRTYIKQFVLEKEPISKKSKTPAASKRKAQPRKTEKSSRSDKTS